MAVTISKKIKGDNGRQTESLKLLGTLDAKLTPQVTQLTLTGESLSTSDSDTFSSAVDAVDLLIEQVIKELPDGETVSEVCENAAAWGALLALDPNAAQTRELPMNSSRGKLHRVIEATGAANTDYSQVTECFNNDCDGDELVLNTIKFNMGACAGNGRSGLVGNLYPVIVMDPSVTGYKISVNMLSITNSITHDTSGKLADVKRVNLLRALADHTILEGDGILATPVHTPESAGVFIDAAVLAPTDKDRNGEAYKTSFVKDRTEFNAIGISQTPVEVQSGLANETFALQRTGSLTDVVVKFGADVVTLSLRGIPSAELVAGTNGSKTTRIINLNTKSVNFSSKTTLASGTAVTEADLLLIAAGKYTAHIAIEAVGNVDTRYGATKFSGVSLSLAALTDEAGENVSVTADPGLAIKTMIESGTILAWGYRLYRCNANMSTECIQIASDCLEEEYHVPGLCPISTKAGVDGKGGVGIDVLTNTVRIRMESHAATHLLDSVDQIEDLYRAARLSDRPEVLGLGRTVVNPAFIRKTIDLTTVVNRSAAERRMDLRATLVDAVNEMVARLWSSAEMEGAHCYIRGGTDKPTVNIITSTHLANYLRIDGDARLLGDMFDVKVSVTPDRRFDNADKGKIIMTFSNYDEKRSTEIDLLSWGSLLYASDVVFDVLTPQGKGVARELMVQPRYRYINSLPVVAVLDVNNLSSAALNVAPDAASPW